MELMEKFIEEMKKNEESKEGLEDIQDEFLCLMEAMASDDEKVLAMGESISKICVENEFTPFEMASMCSTLIVGSVVVRAKMLGVQGARTFFKHLVTALELAVDGELKELEEDDSTDADSTCKCK